MIPALTFALRNWKLILGGLALTTLALMLTFARMDAQHWRKVAEAERTAHAQTVANYRLATEQARRADAENVNRVRTEQAKITEDITHDYEARIADARARAAALRMPRPTPPANPGGGGEARLPAVSDAASGPDAAPREDGFSLSDRLIATETALRLKALQAWVLAQSKIDVNGQQ